MNKYIKTTLAFCFCTLQALAQNEAIAWIQYDNTNSQGSIVRLDSTGNVIVCGELYSPGNIIGTQTMKYDANGQVLWKNKYDTFAQDVFVDCETTADGSVYTLLNSVDYQTQNGRFILFKYLADGTVAWQYSYGNTLPIGNRGASLLTDPGGNIYVVGTVQYFALNEGGLLLLKISPTGELLWEAYYSGYGALNARLIADRVYIWGGVGNKFFCWQVNSAGQSLAAHATEDYFGYYMNSQHIDSNGNFYVGSECCEYRVTKFSPEGEKKWEYQKPVTAPNPPTVQARLSNIVTDTDNNVYVAGPFFENAAVNMVCLTTKLSEDGTMIWEKSMAEEGFKFLAPHAAFINEKEVYITGSMTRTVGDNLYEPFILVYDFDGIVLRKLFLDIDGERNTPESIICDHETCFLTAVSFKMFNADPTRQVTLKISPTSSTEETLVPAQGMQVFPNPNTGQATLVLDGWNGGQPGLLQVYDLQGREVFRSDLASVQVNGRFTVALSDTLASGTYQLVLSQYPTALDGQICEDLAHFKRESSRMNDEQRIVIYTGRFTVISNFGNMLTIKFY